MSIFAVETDPPVNDQQIDRVHALWKTREHDTLSIAKAVGLKEHQVYGLLHRVRR